MKRYLIWFNDDRWEVQEYKFTDLGIETMIDHVMYNLKCTWFVTDEIGMGILKDKGVID